MAVKASLLLSAFACCVSVVSGHATMWHPSMWGFNVTSSTFSYDNRPVVPLMQLSYEEWWFHNHLNYPPNDGDYLEVPAGSVINAEIACDKGATQYYASSAGGNVQSGNNPCPGSPTTAFHASNIEDTRGCALGIAYKSDISQVEPGDFTIFTTNKTCVWYRYTDFQVPAALPACPDEGCICGFFWTHAPDSGSEQIYMNGYKCKVTGATSTVPVATSRVPRRCGVNPGTVGGNDPSPWNCTYGAKQPIYWDQKENNNLFEDVQAPPFYNQLYGYADGPQDDIFQNSEIPVFDENGDVKGYTTLGSSTATTASIVTPTIATGWPTSVSLSTDAAAMATGTSNSSSSSSSNSSSLSASSASSATSTSGSSATPAADVVNANPGSGSSSSSSSHSSPHSAAHSSHSASSSPHSASSSASSSSSSPTATPTESPKAALEATPAINTPSANASATTVIATLSSSSGTASPTCRSRKGQSSVIAKSRKKHRRNVHAMRHDSDFLLH